MILRKARRIPEGWQRLEQDEATGQGRYTFTGHDGTQVRAIVVPPQVVDRWAAAFDRPYLGARAYAGDIE
jgi:hypothetical protein